MRETFRRFAEHTSKIVGTAWAFLAALLIVILWAVLGPAFHFSDTWQLVINTGTTIVTFLVVFLIQNTQNRQDLATQLKLDELLEASRKTRKELVDVEDLSEDEMRRLEEQFKKFRESQQKRVPGSGPA